LSISCNFGKAFKERGSISEIKYVLKNITIIDNLFKIIEKYQHIHRKLTDRKKYLPCEAVLLTLYYPCRVRREVACPVVQSASPLCSQLYLSALQPALSTLKVQLPFLCLYSLLFVIITCFECLNDFIVCLKHIPALVGCVGKLVDVAMDCQTCIKGLVCCVTDSCR
jgi:hypothetical protein